MTDPHRGDAFRPVVALDVDGALRIPEPRFGEVDAISVQVTMRRAAYPPAFHSQPRWDERGLHHGLEFFSATGVRWVKSLVSRGIDVRWCSTWRQYVSTYFAPPLGLPALPVLAAQTWVGDTSLDWKERSIAGSSRGRPVLWVDDRPWEFGLVERHSPRALASVRGVDPRDGITDKDVEAMEAWLALASSPEGHSELRRRRRLELDRLRRSRRESGQ